MIPPKEQRPEPAAEKAADPPAAEPATEAAAEAAPEPAPEPPPGPEPVVLRPYDLPTARRVVQYGLTLAYRASSDLRRASLYIGLLTLAILGPAVVYVVEFAAHYQLVEEGALTQLFSDPSTIGVFVSLLLTIYAALACWFAVTIDGQLIGIALLAARAGDRPFTLREATIRARQAFWRLIRGGLLTGVGVGMIQLLLLGILIWITGFNSAEGFVASLIASLVVAPLGYLATGIVLGDVGAVEALRRSIRLARARPSIALVVALFTVVTGAIQTFALSAGLDLVFRGADLFHVGVSGGVLPLVITILGLLAFVMAFGSLTFTIAAIVAAPQVAAFLGLTFFSGGLDRARDLPADAPTFRWVTRPMLVAIGLMALVSGAGILYVRDAPPIAPDPIVELLRGRASVHGSALVLIGGRVRVADPAGDGSGRGLPATDIVVAEYADVSAVPPWLLDEVFDCGAVNVACTTTIDDAAFSDGAVLVLERLVALPASVDGAWAQWGMALQLAGYDPAPPTDARFPGATHAVVTSRRASLREVAYMAWDGKGWRVYRSFARSMWQGDDLLTLIPIRDEIQSVPLAWDVFASYAPDTGADPYSRDSLRGPDGRMVALPYFAPELHFSGGSLAPGS